MSTLTALAVGALMVQPAPAADPDLASPSSEQSPAWSAVEGARATVLHAPGDGALAARLLALAEAQAPLPGMPPGVPTHPRIYLARDEAAFDEVTGGRIPDWGAGVAIPAEGVIVLPLFASGRGRGVDLPAVLRHEWAHVALYEHLAGRRAPRWFDEGYAQWASGGWDAMEGWRLRVAFATGRAPPLDSLALRWPRGRADAELAYGLSATVLEYLVEESGVRGLEVLLARWPDVGFEAALRRTYGVTSGQLERDWQKYVKSRYGWLLVLSHSLVFWSVLSVALVVMVLIRRRRDRMALARLRAGEGPDQPAYWADPPSADAAWGSLGSMSWTGRSPPATRPWHVTLGSSSDPDEDPAKAPGASSSGGEGSD